MVNERKKITVLDFVEKKRKNEKITVLTAYDYQMAKVLDEVGLEELLVGDSLGMVIYGYNSTLPVTLEDTIRHTQAVVRATKYAVVVGDMPWMTYATPEDAVHNAGKLIKEGGCDAIKLEGGREREKAIKLMVESGMAVQGHIGLTPTYVNQFGGFKLQAKTAAAAEHLIEDAKILEEAGVFSIVLETIPWKVAKVITESLHIPTIGIGAGQFCSGQVLVSQDMMGFCEATYFKFLKKYGNVYEVMKSAASSYVNEVKNGIFPNEQYSYPINDEEFNQFMEQCKRKKTI